MQENKHEVELFRIALEVVLVSMQITSYPSELKYPGFLRIILYNFYEIRILLCKFKIYDEKNFDETLRFTYL